MLVAPSWREVTVLRSVREVIIGYAVALLVASSAVGQDDRGTVPLSSILPTKGVLSIVPWSVSGGDLVCVVSQKPNKGGPVAVLTTKTLSIYRKRGSRLMRIYRFQTPDTLLNMFPLGELDARLLTTWTGGSAYHIRAFAYVDGRVQQVLEAGSRGMPEVIIDENERESILVTQMQMTSGQWSRTPTSETDIYRWNGKTYEKVGPVPWAKRFQ